MASIPPVSGPQPNGPSSSSSSSASSSTKKVNDVALESLASRTGAAAAASSSSDNQYSSELELLKKKLQKVWPDYMPPATEDLISQSGQILADVRNSLAEKILQQYSTDSTTKSSDAGQIEVEKSVTSSIRAWQVYTRKPPANESVRACFSDESIVEPMYALCSSDSKYSDLAEIAQIMKDLADLVERMNRPSSHLGSSADTPKSSTGTPGGRRGSSEGSIDSSNSQLEKAAESYRTTNSLLAQNQANGVIDSGAASKSNAKMLGLFYVTDVVVLGEGDHQEYALDAMIIDSKLPETLVQAGVKTVVAEHIYPEHVSKLQGPDCSEVAKHLADTAFGNPGKAFNYLQFLRSCAATGIEVIAADTKEIYRPAGLNIDTYNQTDRLEALNANVVKLHEANKDKGKMLIILGAAHSNHLNATASRAQMGPNKPNYRTPGVTDVIPEAQELIVVKKRSAEEISGRIPLQSIRDGMVFQVEI